jgi:hypothetical protein
LMGPRVVCSPAVSHEFTPVRVMMGATPVNYGRYMNMGHAAGVAASLVAVAPGATVQRVNLPRLQQLLAAQGVRFSTRPPPPRPADVFTCGLGRCVASQNGPYASSNCSSACRPLGPSEWLGSAQVGGMERFHTVLHLAGDVDMSVRYTATALLVLPWPCSVAICTCVHSTSRFACAIRRKPTFRMCAV